MNERYTEVLSQYELDINAVRRGRGAWLCDTEDGVKLLREYKGTARRLEFEDQVLDQLQDQGCLCVDRYIRNREGELSSQAEDGTKFILKDWYNDRECNLKDSEEICWTVEKIACLHKVLRRIDFKEEWSMGSIVAQSLYMEMDRHNQELKRARTFIRNKRKKSDFELCVIQNFDQFYRQAEAARDGMGKLQENGIDSNLFLCHGELNHHHILMGSRDIAIVEFNRMHLGVQVADLYHFVRKAMEKHDWDLRLGTRMLDVYDRILPMTDKERSCLYYLFLYPEKYWKQINFYYNANKAWIPARNLEKLRELENQQGSRYQFLERIK